MANSSHTYEYVKGTRGLQAVFLATFLILLANTALSYAESEKGKLILKTESGDAITNTVSVQADQSLVLKLEQKDGQVVDTSDIARVKLDPDDGFFKVEAVSGKRNEVKLTLKDIKFTASKINKEVVLTYTPQPGSAVSSDKVTISIQPNVHVSVTVAGKNVAAGGNVFITEGTTKQYTVEIKLVKDQNELPDPDLLSESTDVKIKAPDLGAAPLQRSGDQKVVIRAASGADEVAGFQITATVLQKAQSIELDKQVSSLDEGTSVTVQAQLKSKDGTLLSVVDQSRYIVAAVDESSPGLVRIAPVGNNKFKITALLINDKSQTAAAQKPAGQKPVAQSPAAQSPAAQKPVAKKPAAQKPVAQKPAAQQPAAQKPAAQKRAAQKLAAQKPATQEPAAREPAAQEPAAQEPAAQEPAAQEPAAQEPADVTAKNVKIDFKIVQDGIDPPVIGFELSLFVEPTFGYITFTPPPIAFLLPNGNVTTIAQVRGQKGEPLANPVNFKLEDEDANRKWVIISQEGNQLNVYWNEPVDSELKKADGTLEKRPPQVVILANSFVGEHKIQSKVFIRMGEIAKFAPLKVKLNIMDQRTARDLYGGVTSDEYYVLTVRLFNNLKDEDSKQYLGSSILAYSASVEVAVGLEKKFNSKLKSDQAGVISKEKSQEFKDKRTKGLDELSNEQVKEDKTALDAFQKQINGAVKAQREAEIEAADRENKYQEVKFKSELDKESKESKEVEEARRAADSARAVADAKLDQLVGLQSQIAKSAEARAYAFKQLVEYGDWGLTVDDGKWHSMRRGDLYKIAPTIKSYRLPDRRVISETKPDDDPICTGVVKYRPFSFEMMVNTVDRRDERGLRSRIFQLLNGLGTATSFFTAVLQPPKSNSTPLVLEKYSNLLLPALDKLFPSLKEQQRQNIVSQAMKVIEEIPFGSDITRVLFIPKKEIRGLLSGHDVRISEVCPFYFSIEVAIVKKGGVVQQGSATP